MGSNANMRSTAPTVRRRNHNLFKGRRRWIDSRSDDDNSASSDDEAPAPARLPATVAGQARPSSTLRALSGLGTVRSAAQATLVPVTLPATTFLAVESDSDSGIDGGVESDSGDEDSGDEAVVSPPPAAVAPPLAAISTISTSAIAAPSLPPLPPQTISTTSASSSSSSLPPLPTPDQPVLAPVDSPVEATLPLSTSTTASTLSTSSSKVTVIVFPVPTVSSSSSQETTLSSVVTSRTSTAVAVDITTSVPQARAKPGESPTQTSTLAVSTPATTTAIASPDFLETSQGEQQGVIDHSAEGTSSSSAAISIVFGVLAGIGVLVAVALFVRKRRRRAKQGYPLPPFLSRSGVGGGGGGGGGGDAKRKSSSTWAWGLWDSSSSSSGRTTMAPPRAVAPPLPFLPPPKFGRVSKTNTDIMDNLMRAAYQAEGGQNDMESRVNAVEKPGFMDEKAYAMLAGRPAPPERKRQKPISRWLDGLMTPRVQSRVPSMPPTPGTLPRRPESLVPQLPPPLPSYLKNRDTVDTSTGLSTGDWYRLGKEYGV
ncbi:hypothetical protein B0T26DRAFT_36111 [Lasiosphaeria miniovina]|uniref:Uncharacterized protein n=1 Tax=Lasiosphaeria miniovina TaxID=1954250 RepID=A0AA40BGE1_9PEZI|nr:uncharacterized protein B0T26DRAFT_36111 [Lasiosphaeria miniovina]KAK0733770.1 hypothetical protein B0T26DRAFT_36111 [Lasiosphaeria miniovina]